MALLATLVAVCGLLGFTWWLLAHYKDAKVSTVVHAAVFASWVLGFLGLLLLPMDLATNGISASSQSAADIAEQKATLREYLNGWRLLYWLTFLMSWVGLPFLVEFRQNGEFELDKRVLSSLRHLVFHWTVLAGGVLVVALYLILVDHLSLYGVLGLAMAASNTYGLLWVIALLGYGLVEIPRGFWMRRLDSTQLQILHFQEVQLQDERMEARFEYDDVVADVRDAYQRMIQAECDAIILTSEMQYVRTCLLQVITLVEANKPAFSSLGGSSDTRRTNKSALLSDMSSKLKRGYSSSGRSSVRKAPTLPQTVALHRRVRIAQLELRRCDQAFLELCINVDILQDRNAQRSLPAGSLYPETSALNRLYNMFLDMRQQLRRWITSPVAVGCAIVTGFLSLWVAWGELTMGWHESSLSLFLFLIVVEAEETSSSLRSATELISALLLVYLALCCYTSLFTLRLPGKYALRSHGNSTELCLLKTSIHQCRLQFSWSKCTTTTSWRRAWGNHSFQRFAGEYTGCACFRQGVCSLCPLAMIALAVFTLTNGYARVMRRLGIDQYEQVNPDDPSHATSVAEGEKLVQQGLERFRVLISRKKKIYETGAAGGGSYGFTSTAAGTQSQLVDDDDQEDTNSSESVV